MLYITTLYCFLAVILLVTKSIQWNFTQNSFTVIHERGELSNYNPEYFDHISIKNYKFNRTQAATNATFVVIKDWNRNVKIEFEAFKFMSNEYRDFPIKFSYNFCECLHKNDFGFGSFLECGNLTMNNCVIKKGIYFVCNFHPKSENYPPHIPSGSYKMVLKWFDGPKEMFGLDAYQRIEYKFP